MEWRDEGLVIGLKRHGETSVILELMTRNHGRHLGIVRGGRSRRMQPLLQPGNFVEAVWRARIDEHLGMYAIEATDLHASRLMASPLALHGINHMGALLRLMAERDSHPALYETVKLIVEHLDEMRIAPALLVRFELAILTELGFGLDLSVCAATGKSEDLVYVSPKSGRAVCREAGLPWHDRLLKLPDFLSQARAVDNAPDAEGLCQGFDLTGYFLERDVFAPRGLKFPESRRALLALLR